MVADGFRALGQRHLVQNAVEGVVPAVLARQEGRERRVAQPQQRLAREEAEVDRRVAVREPVLEVADPQPVGRAAGGDGQPQAALRVDDGVRVRDLDGASSTPRSRSTQSGTTTTRSRQRSARRSRR
jgi:hypothetical protein